MINKILEQNLYSILLKIMGIGYLLIGIGIIIFLPKYDLLNVGNGMAFGIVFIGMGEIINLLQKLLTKRK